MDYLWHRNSRDVVLESRLHIRLYTAVTMERCGQRAQYNVSQKNHPAAKDPAHGPSIQFDAGPRAHNRSGQRMCYSSLFMLLVVHRVDAGTGCVDQ